MSDDDRDALAESFAALREEKAGLSANAAATRRALLLDASHRHRRRSGVVRLVLPLAAVFIVSTAWAAATGRLETVSSVVAALVQPRGDGERIDAPVAEEASTARVDIAPVVAEAGALQTKAPKATATVVPPAARRKTSPSHAEHAADPEAPLYQSAHTAFFVERDWPRALAAWEVYLATFPNGRFAPEAGYNRALTLVRLGRHEEARAALRPFAEGARYGGYRQSEAKALLDAMP